MKTKFIALALLASFGAQAGIINFADIGKTGRYCPGDTLSIDVSRENSYVERMLISAEGIRNDGFIKVFADGELVHNIGIPGYDPDYSFRVRREVKNITFKFEETCARILAGQIFSATEAAPASYRRYRAERVNDDNWGAEFLDITRSLSQDLQYEKDFYSDLWPKVLLPMKKIALLSNASELVRDERSLITAHRSLKMAKIINDNQELLDRLLFSGRFDYVILDILRIKEDILERYDVKDKKIESKILELEAELDL
jgi:hypothetical protein